MLNFGDTIVEWYRTSKARQTFLHKRTWQKNLRAFVHSLDKDDIAFEDVLLFFPVRRVCPMH